MATHWHELPDITHDQHHRALIEIRDLQAENARLREALEEIAHYECGTCQPVDDLDNGRCAGCHAREALGSTPSPEEKA